MRCWWGVRHLRYWWHRRRVHQWAQLWTEAGLGADYLYPYDAQFLQEMWEGKV